jgi:hypothetical protein
VTNRSRPVDLAAWCAYAAIAVALPTALWRLPLAMGATLGTPDAWREQQDIPGGEERGTCSCCRPRSS